MQPTDFLDIYDERELRGLYSEMFPDCLFDEDCWFMKVLLDDSGYLIDGSLSIATKHPEAASFPFYSAKGEKRVRAAQARCTKNFRMTGKDASTGKDATHTCQIQVGVTRGAKRGMDEV